MDTDWGSGRQKAKSRDWRIGDWRVESGWLAEEIGDWESGDW
jgi:hypothetical protein